MTFLCSVDSFSLARWKICWTPWSRSSSISATSPMGPVSIGSRTRTFLPLRCREEKETRQSPPRRCARRPRHTESSTRTSSCRDRSRMPARSMAAPCSELITVGDMVAVAIDRAGARGQASRPLADAVRCRAHSSAVCPPPMQVDSKVQKEVEKKRTRVLVGADTPKFVRPRPRVPTSAADRPGSNPRLPFRFRRRRRRTRPPPPHAPVRPPR